MISAFTGLFKKVYGLPFQWAAISIFIMEVKSMGWNRAPYTEDELITLMKEKAKELGRTPTEIEFKQFQTAIKYFGTWGNFQYAAGLKITYLRDFPDKKNYIIEEIRQLAQNLGRTPYIREYGRADQAKKLFGSWNNALKAANLKINKK